ncbi:M57 family metalloprotease [Cystobacter fuscus]|uniref:M57 family metalloprotease n=1 Tax=Cystobacter fuscus TaxID=43 RepID=UPI002B2ADEB8|nr:hypothetical protein F0U63_25665 [Cystobacter fuscus]
MKKSCSHRPLFLSVALLGALATVGCNPEGSLESSNENEPLGNTAMDFEAFKSQLPRDAESGAYLFEGDIRVYEDEFLRQLQEQSGRPGALIVNTVNTEDDRWPFPQNLNLFYCVSTSFGANHGTVVQAMAEAAAAWQAAANVRFIYQSTEDATCDSDNGNVVFNVRQVSGTPYNASAFFPSYSRGRRELLIDWNNATNSAPKTLTGILRHELGHALGFRHEHTRMTGSCYEDSSWRELTAYDAGSVMHYRQCPGSNWGYGDYKLTDSDKTGAATLYGAADSSLFGYSISTSAPSWCGSTGAAGCLSKDANHLVVGDFNGDGRTDFMSANGNFDTWLSNGNGTFRGSTVTSPPSGCGSTGAMGCLSKDANHVVVGDFNGDGRTDFMSANGNFDTWLSNGDGTFRGPVTTSPPTWCGSTGAAGCLSTEANHVVVGDFNGDGRTDFMSAKGNFDTWLSNGDGTFRSPVTTSPPSWCGSTGAAGCLSTEANHVIVGDFNGDRRTDFMSANGNFDTWLSNGDGTFRGSTVTSPPSWCGSTGAAGCLSTVTNHVVGGDFNGDGRTDFMSANGNFDTWLSNGDGTFRSPVTTSPPSWCGTTGATGCLSTEANHVIVGDFNKDGRVDFMSANSRFDTWFSNGDGSIGGWTPVAPPSWCGTTGATGCLSTEANHVIVGDFNGDGRTDFMSAGSKFETWLTR